MKITLIVSFQIKTEFVEDNKYQQNGIGTLQFLIFPTKLNSSTEIISKWNVHPYVNVENTYAYGLEKCIAISLSKLETIISTLEPLLNMQDSLPSEEIGEKLFE